MKVTCSVCQREFNGRSIQSRYCDSVCRAVGEKIAKQSRNSGEGKGWSKGLEKVPRRICQACGGRFRADPCRVARGGGKFCSNACRGAAIAVNPASYPQTQSRRGKGGKRPDLGDAYFRSAWEANYARYLNWLVSLGQIAGWDYEPETFQFDDIKRGSRFYTPDFRVRGTDGSVEYHEVKGYMDQRSATKLKRFAARFPEKKLVLIDKSQYRSIAAKVSRIILGWEGRSRAD